MERRAPQGLADLVRVHGTERPSAPALVTADRTVTWSALWRRSAQVANALLAGGVGPGDRVAFLDRNSIEHFEVAYGVAMIRAVPVDVNWRLAPPEILAIVRDARAKVLVVGPSLLPAVVPIAEELACQLVAIGARPGFRAYEDWLAGASDVDPGVAPLAGDVALQLYSSGTTGLPKGVMVTNAGLFGLLPVLADLWEVEADSVLLIALPLFHIGASGWASVAHHQGAAIVVQPGVVPGDLIAGIAAHRVTHTVLVPTAIQAVLAAPELTRADVSTLRVLGYGAAPMPERVLARATEAFGCKLWQGYGLTETVGAVTLLRPEDHVPGGPEEHRLRSVGRPAPGCELRIVDPTSGTDLEQGAIGEIVVRTPHLMAGYWNLPEETAQVLLDDGWFRTGDAGWIDEDGYLYLHDRIRDLIVSGGENVFPAEIERVLQAHPDVADVAVIGVPDERWGETPKAFVVLRPGANVGEAGLIQVCRDRLAGFKCPTSVDVVASLLRNPSGKVLKTELRAPFWGGRARRVG